MLDTWRSNVGEALAWAHIKHARIKIRGAQACGCVRRAGLSVGEVLAEKRCQFLSFIEYAVTPLKMTYAAPLLSPDFFPSVMICSNPAAAAGAAAAGAGLGMLLDGAID